MNQPEEPVRFRVLATLLEIANEYKHYDAHYISDGAAIKINHLGVDYELVIKKCAKPDQCLGDKCRMWGGGRCQFGQVAEGDIIQWPILSQYKDINLLPSPEQCKEAHALSKG